ncbi:MAG: hypothetical protein LJF06_17640 [Gemmatimonadetes bacterium]|nr:hypothetical protein [Gemmatimonadota bacterium]
MEARFRIRTREGEEFCPETTELFAEFIRSGAIRPEDLVYDSLTGEWVPAAQHPTVRLVQDALANGWDSVEGVPLKPGPGEADAARGPRDGEGAGREASGVHEAHAEPADEDVPDLPGSLDLVELPSISPEEEARAFIERMEDERRSNPDDEPALSREIRLTSPTAPLKWGAPEAHHASSEDPTPRRRFLRPATFRVTFTQPGRIRHSWTRLGLLGLAAASSLALLAVFASVARPSYRSGDHMSAPAGAETAVPRPPRRIADTEEAVRGAAFQAFVSAVDRMRGTLGVGPVPAAWLSGRYLADPTSYPQVPRYWQRYLEYVEQVQADESSLYRGAYLQALDEARVAGPARSLRLATALEDFDATQDVRAASYKGAWELAAAALALHDTLVDLQGRVSYEPAEGPRVSAAPVIEAAGKDPDAQARLNAALDRVLKALRVNGHTMTVRAVPAWLATNLRNRGDDATATPSQSVAPGR